MNPIETSIKKKIQSNGVQLKDWNIQINYGIKTGFNDAFIISKEKKDELIAADPKSAEIIRPILRGRDIKRYEHTFADLWLINTHNGIKSKNILPINIEDYPAIKDHLDNFYSKLEKRADKGDTPYNLRNCVYMDDFSKQKIVYREISDEMNACLIEDEVYVNNKCYIITGEHLEHLICVLNSKLFNKITLQCANSTGGKGRDFLNTVTVSKPDTNSKLCELYTEMISLPADKQLELSNQIDHEVCLLYGLSDEEITYIDNL